MTLAIRKFLVLLLIGVIFLAANIWCVAHWLERRGVVDLAREIREHYLTGTALTVIFVLLILLVKPRRSRSD